MTRRISSGMWLSLTMAAVVAFAGPTWAASVNVTDDRRKVEARLTPFDGPVIQDDAFGTLGNLFDETVTATIPPDGAQSGSEVIASQVSDYGSSGDLFVAQAQGAIVIQTGVAQEPLSRGESVFEIDFDLSDAELFSARGKAFTEDDFFASVSFRLTGPGGDVFDVFTTAPGMITLDESGMLGPGSYTLLARTIGGGDIGVDVTADFELDFVVGVPTPTAAAAGFVALAGLALRRRRR